MLEFLNTIYTAFTPEKLTRTGTSARAFLQTRETIFTSRTSPLLGVDARGLGALEDDALDDLHLQNKPTPWFSLGEDVAHFGHEL